MNIPSADPIQSLRRLCEWLDKSDYSGYDPYDIKEKPGIILLTEKGNQGLLFALIREFVFELFYSFPLLSRKLLRVEPKINAKAMGVLARAYLELYEVLKEEQFLTKARKCLQWLKENQGKTLVGIGWGYPFHWQSKILIPAGTPNGIVTTAAAEAFWHHHLLFGDEESLDYCRGICEFLSSLPVDPASQNGICFSYTPLFINHVHNLNLFVAEFLIKMGKLTGETTWTEMGNKAVNYTVEQQLPSGAFDYNGPPEKPQHHIDSYHTGFVIRMLFSIWKLTGRKDVYTALEKCYRHYTAAFFEDGVIPKIMSHRKYRIDIHSCAEGILCLSELSQVFPDAMQQAGKVLDWTLENLQDTSGYFYFGILKSRFTGIPFISKIPYIRWGQAWMLRAMSSYLSANNRNKAYHASSS